VYVVQDGRERCKLASDIQEVYVVPDGRERCLWLQMTVMGVCGVGCPREVYVVSNGREMYVSVRCPREVYVVQDDRERCMLASDIQERCM
jgi:hypothetical protein